MPTSIQDFLIKSSIFDLVQPGLMKNFISAEDAEEVLEKLARRSLMITAVYDEQRGWPSRYHQMFRDFLPHQDPERFLPGRIHAEGVDQTAPVCESGIRSSFARIE